MLRKFKYVLYIMRTYAGIQSGFYILQKIVMAALVPIQLALLQRLVDHCSNQVWNLKFVVMCTIALLLAMFLSSGSEYINETIRIRIREKLDLSFAEHIINKFSKICYACFENSETQNILVRMGDQPQGMIIMFFEDCIGLMSMIVEYIGILLLFVQVSWWFPLLFIGVILIMIFLDYKSMKMMNDMFVGQTENERKLEYYSELLSQKKSLVELRVFSAKQYISGLWNKKNKQVLKERLQTTIRSELYLAISLVVMVLWAIMLILTIIQQFSSGNITLGIMVSLIGSLESVMSIEEDLSYTLSNVARHSIIIEQYKEFLSLPEEVEPKSEKELSLPISIEFDNVSFSYPGTDVKILNNLSFKITSGEHVALVGENGAGKTTIIKLLLRLYEPDQGEIRIGGIKLSEMTRKQIAKFFGVIFQDFCHYQGSIRENVIVGDPTAVNDDKRIHQALFQSQYGDIEDIDIHLGKLDDQGRDISGGQWQRLALARALVREHEFMIMDEPTASLDPIAESKMYEMFASQLERNGYILISHRLASARFSDRILLIEKGRIAENGTHEELIAKGGSYAAMWNTQSSWYQMSEGER